ncbi:MAG: MBL fold metallo-hydrolase [Planctomycetota bacterium]
MDLGFETIGNATSIYYDGGPLLATDPWLDGSAYFGSWVHQHEIPAAQREAIRGCPYLWISHGHPDHLSLESLEGLRGCDILLPDHYGGRVQRDLREAGFRVWVLKCGLWTQLTDRVRVMSIADCHQDASLLVDLDGTLIVNANDASDRGAGAFVAQLVPKFKRSILLSLVAYGDADMINYFDEDGNRIPPQAAKKEPLGPGIAGILDQFGIDDYVPFSTLHKYQRTDSAWVNDFITTPADMRVGFESDKHQILPPYVHFDLARDDCYSLDPAPSGTELKAPEEFGDSWSDELDPDDVERLKAYFEPITHLRSFLGFVRFKVGGKEHVIDVNREHGDRGVTFETPRASLMEAVKWKVFDDLLIGNFTKTTVHGDWPDVGAGALYPDFNPFVTKYGDNGGAYTPDELRAYFAEYHRRGFFGFGMNETEQAARRSLAQYLPPGV